MIWVADRGFTSAANRRHLAAGADGYILGEQLRSGSPEATAALSRQGRYQQVAENLRVKEVKVGEHDRFVVCHNPDAAERGRRHREPLIAQLEAMIEDHDQLNATKRAELRGVISTRPGPHRFQRTTPSGCCAWTRRRSPPMRNWTEKYLLRTNDPRLSGEDVARGYKQLLEVERGWRGMKQVLDLRPVFPQNRCHRLEDRIRAHVLLCWLALLLIRTVETRTVSPDGTSTSWPRARESLQRPHVGLFSGPAGTFR